MAITRQVARRLLAALSDPPLPPAAAMVMAVPADPRDPVERERLLERLIEELGEPLDEEQLRREFAKVSA